MRLVLASIAWVLSIALAIALSAAPRRIAYDCSLASFHPDYPTKVREACRRQR